MLVNIQEWLLTKELITQWSLQLCITEVCLIFKEGTHTFAAWAVLGEGCSSARGPNQDPGAFHLIQRRGLHSGKPCDRWTLRSRVPQSPKSPLPLKSCLRLSHYLTHQKGAR